MDSGWIIALGVVLILSIWAPLIVRAKVILSFYLAGTFLAGRNFAAIGLYPFFLGDVLMASLAGALILGRGKAWLRGTALAQVVMLAFSLLILWSVLRGHAHGYPTALKFASLSLTAFCCSIAIAKFATSLQGFGELARKLSMLSIPGFFGSVAVFGRDSAVPASYGLYFTVASCLAIAHDASAKRRVSAKTLLVILSSGCGLVITAKRGPILAYVLGCGVTYLLYRIHIRRDLRAPVALGLLGVGSAAGIIVLMPDLLLSNPMIGEVIHRVVQSSEFGTESEANIALRLDLWRYSLEQAFKNPLGGLGAGAPLAITFRDISIAEWDITPHNSFISLAYYAGIPSLSLFALLLARASQGLWVRRTEPLAHAQIGILVAIVCTATTNVALEAPYIGGVSLLMLSWMLGMPSDRNRYANRVQPVETGGTGDHSAWPPIQRTERR